MNLINPWTEFRSAPLATIARWQDQRFLWILMAAMSMAMLLLAHTVFQHWLYMRPCEQCVYIRFAFFCMVLGGLVAAINPRIVALKLVGYGLASWGIYLGIGYSAKLARIHTAAHGDNPFGVQGCSTEATYPFGLPLDRWSPDWFQPTGDCGYDNPIVPTGTELGQLQGWLVDFYADGWYVWPPAHFGTMAEATLLTFVICALVLGVAAVAWIATRTRTPMTARA